MILFGCLPGPQTCACAVTFVYVVAGESIYIVCVFRCSLCFSSQALVIRDHCIFSASSKPCTPEVSHSISVNHQNTNRQGSQQPSEAPVHMVFARRWEFPALLLVWKTLGLVWKAALRAVAEDRVSLSGWGPGKRGVVKPACGFDQIFPHLSWHDALLFQELFCTPAAGGGGWVTDTGSELGKREFGETSGVRKERNCPFFFLHEIFSTWSRWTHGLIAMNDICDAGAQKQS